MSQPDMLTHLETANIQASTYLRAWYQQLARRLAAGCCCSHPDCPRAGHLALWLEKQALPAAEA